MLKSKKKADEPAIVIPKAELKKRLTPIQYKVTQDKGTERAFTGTFYKCKDPGIYSCVCCGKNLFSSVYKYDSGSGWPAFSDVLDEKSLRLKKDTSGVGANLLLLLKNPSGLIRTEVTCANCHAHLGHVFDDGPKPTGKRYCINSAALAFEEKEELDGVAPAAEDKPFEFNGCALTADGGVECSDSTNSPSPPPKPEPQPKQQVQEVKRAPVETPLNRETVHDARRRYLADMGVKNSDDIIDGRPCRHGNLGKGVPKSITMDFALLETSADSGYEETQNGNLNVNLIEKRTSQLMHSVEKATGGTWESRREAKYDFCGRGNPITWRCDGLVQERKQKLINSVGKPVTNSP